MKISVFGMGYVGSVTAACLATQGHEVIGVDVNQSKIDMINAGRTPVLEPALGDLIRDSVLQRRLRATNCAAEAVAQSDLSLVCVGTPSLGNGKLDLSGINQVCCELGRALRNKNGFATIVLRSTVLPGTTEAVVLPTLQSESGKAVGGDFALCYHPEFMREGTAVADFYSPPFTIIGASEPKQGKPVGDLYPFLDKPVVYTNIRLAEMLKYVCNAFHALKIAFANEIGTIASAVGVNSQELMSIFCLDHKLNISSSYLKPGISFGGSCLPKDLRAILYGAKELDLTLPLVESILPSNRLHLARILDLILKTGKKRIAILGLSFKMGTDDLRESPITELVKVLLGEGCKVKIYDPQVEMSAIVGANRQFIEQTIPHIGRLLRSSLESTLKNAELVLVAQDNPRFEKVYELADPTRTVIRLWQWDKLTDRTVEPYTEPAPAGTYLPRRTPGGVLSEVQAEHGLRGAERGA